jgi:tetratricopeptide (TPR) repeat protein
LFILPVSGIVPFGYQFFSTVADRYAYLAMLGPAFAVSFALTEISGFMACRAVCSTCAVGLCLMSFVSAKQAATWRNTQTLFAHAAAINPGDWLPHNQLGMSYLRQQNFPAAERQFRMVVTLGPVDSRFWVSLGQSVEQQKRYPEAAYYFSQALTISPGFSNALYFRAQCEAMTNQPALAVADYTAAIPGLPPTTYADNELAMEFGAMGRYSDAATEFAKTVHLHPDYLPAYYFLAMTDTKLGNHKAAQQAAETALAINPNYTPVMPYVSVASAHP